MKKSIKKVAAFALLLGGIAGSASAHIAVGTYCLSLASGPSIGKCVSATYGVECNRYATSGSDCAGNRTVIDNIGG
ncbi:hypothetical protein K2F45_19625 [Sphingobacterium siyangense]|uniref:DUF3551 domain-containing protein n=1 Tax=Sphingobacterium detergens TaxID=1145106 RepID=A0A420ADN6_SPHD1|nr:MULTISPECIES: hypothetical protein [Sphingobacterium]RKE42561.1 hypothetical protein DFQ12_5474 [Sphingobacterium detergens]UQA74003.1 hypothetical protein K2F45_19625 [Sphingobacterium siyangense]